MRLNDCQDGVGDAILDRGDLLVPWPTDLAYAMVLDGPNGEIAITDFMVRRACERIDEEDVSPFREVIGHASGQVVRTARRAS